MATENAHLRTAETIQHPGAPVLLVLILGDGGLPYEIKLGSSSSSRGSSSRGTTSSRSSSSSRTAVSTAPVAAECSTPDRLPSISTVVIEEQRFQACHRSSPRHSEGQLVGVPAPAAVAVER